MFFIVPTFFSITGVTTGGSQIVVPGGTKQFSFTVLSGIGYVNGTSYTAPYSTTLGGMDRDLIMTFTGQVTIGATGSGNVVAGWYLH